MLITLMSILKDMTVPCFKKYLLFPTEKCLVPTATLNHLLIKNEKYFKYLC